MKNILPLRPVFLLLLGVLFALILITQIVNPPSSQKPESDTTYTVRTNQLSQTADSLIFPKNFIWGVALSAFQNDGGGGRTDWDEWPTYKNHPAHHPGFTGEDISFAASFDIKSIRFSIEWARVETTQGAWDKSALTHYVELARTMIQNDILPVINLNHFTLPAWVAHKNGWENDSTEIWFAEYTKRVAKAFKPLHIKYWMTFNEPTVIISEGYINGNFPPQKENALGAILNVSKNLIHAHRAAYDALHRTLDTPHERIMVGIANYDPFLTPHDKRDKMDTLVTEYLNISGPHAFITAIDDRLDYLGINYYGRSFIKFSVLGGIFRGSPVEFMKPYAIPESPNISFDPEGLYDAVNRYRIYRKPIIITENGINDGEDRYRPSFLIEHLKWLHRAIEKGNELGEPPILGYFYWTLMDNAEWGSLDTPTHFGLIGVDAKTNYRFIRKSVLLYRDIIRANGITEEIKNEYIAKTRE